VSTEITAPIAGKILQILVRVGDSVKKNAHIAKLEAMKMENPVLSVSDGVVKEIRVNVGDEVEADDLLMILE
jgi:biotin carboxyl carrier protein